MSCPYFQCWSILIWEGRSVGERLSFCARGKNYLNASFSICSQWHFCFATSPSISSSHMNPQNLLIMVVKIKRHSPSNQPCKNLIKLVIIIPNIYYMACISLTTFTLLFEYRHSMKYILILLWSFFKRYRHET